MSVSWTTPTAYTLNRLLPLSGVELPRCSAGFVKVCDTERRGFCFYIDHKRDTRTLFAGRDRLYSIRSDGGDWEDPEDGSEESDDEEEAEENNLDFESDWEDERGVVVVDVRNDERSQTSQSVDDLIKEVEHMLEPEEREILEQYATPNLDRISTAKWNPFHTLALSGQISSMDKLLEQGLSIDAMDKDGLTALHVAILRNKTDVITHLLRKGANPNVSDKDGATPLHYAVHVGVMHIVKLLVKNNADLNVADNEGWTPLHVAAQTRSRDIMKVMLINGADSSRRNKDGNTALDISLCYGKDFKSYDLAVVLKTVPANREL